MPPPIHSTDDLARHLGVSRWTVSRAINGQSGVSAKTTEDVRRAMRELGFTPSPHGRGLRGQRTGVIGICFRAMDTPVTIQKIAHVQRLVGEQGYRSLFELTGVHPSGGLDVINHFISMRVEGVLLVDAPPEKECRAWTRLLAENEIPAVFLEPRGVSRHNTVHIDREGALETITEHLLAGGHSSLGLLGISTQFPLGIPRFKGVQKAVAKRKLSFEKTVSLFDVPEHRALGLRYGRELGDMVLAASRKPTAFIALNDEVAAGAMWRLQRAGWSCPRDFAIAGFDNLPISEQTEPALTTVDHRVEISAAAATSMLFEMIAQSAITKRPAVKVEPAILYRGSTA